MKLKDKRIEIQESRYTTDKSRIDVFEGYKSDLVLYCNTE